MKIKVVQELDCGCVVTVTSLGSVTDGRRCRLRAEAAAWDMLKARMREMGIGVEDTGTDDAGARSKES